jgi:hypothetical protein
MSAHASAVAVAFLCFIAFLLATYFIEERKIARAETASSDLRAELKAILDENNAKLEQRLIALLAQTGKPVVARPGGTDAPSVVTSSSVWPSYATDGQYTDPRSFYSAASRTKTDKITSHRYELAYEKYLSRYLKKGARVCR